MPRGGRPYFNTPLALGDFFEEDAVDQPALNRRSRVAQQRRAQQQRRAASTVVAAPPSPPRQRRTGRQTEAPEIDPKDTTPIQRLHHRIMTLLGYRGPIRPLPVHPGLRLLSRNRTLAEGE